jgi:fructose-bisphosphate aldolase class I
MNRNDLAETAQALVAAHKGILAADESAPTMEKRLSIINVPSTAENRRTWRELLFTTPGINETISGVILFDETLRQDAADGRRLAEVLHSQDIMPGIKVDAGAKPLAGAPNEKITEGLDGLRERLSEYHDLGARFTKWRAPIGIGPGVPSRYCIDVSAHALARFAALSQEAGLVPIVEPEVVMAGDHDIDRCFEVTAATQRCVFEALATQQVALEGMLLKPNMILSGTDAPDRADAAGVAAATLRCFRRTVPAAVPGITFLSGGQGDEEATINLDAINRLAQAEGAPWQLSYSYGRGLLATPLRIWGGEPANVPAAQAAFQERTRVVSAARDGIYDPTTAKEPARA